MPAGEAQWPICPVCCARGQSRPACLATFPRRFRCAGRRQNPAQICVESVAVADDPSEHAVDEAKTVLDELISLDVFRMNVHWIVQAFTTQGVCVHYGVGSNEHTEKEQDFALRSGR